PRPSHRPARGAAGRQRQLPRGAAGVDGVRGSVLGTGRSGRADRAGAERAAGGRGHRGRRRAVLPDRAAFAAHPAGRAVMLRIERVTVRYGGSVAVSALTESAAEGEWVGLIGANGAGKSSLLPAAAQLGPYDGTVRVAGETMGGLPPRGRARLIAYVPQQPELPAGMSAIDYTLLGRTPHIGYFGVESAQDRRICAQVLDRIGVSGLADRN